MLQYYNKHSSYQTATSNLIHYLQLERFLLVSILEGKDGIVIIAPNGHAVEVELTWI